jgi:exopolysaccharide biosynthesis polyprenyl glycosylphosphotransferase
VLLYVNNKAHSPLGKDGLYKDLRSIPKVIFFGAILLMGLMYFLKFSDVSRIFIVMFLVVDAALLVIARICAYYYIARRNMNSLNQKNILIVGTGKRGVRIAELIQNHKEWGVKVIGFIEQDPEMVGKDVLGVKVMGLLKDLPVILTNFQVDDVIFAGPRSWLDQIQDAVRCCEEIGVRAQIACDFWPTSLTKINLDTLGGQPLLSLTPPPDYGELFAVKRTLDLCFSSFIILLMLPVFIVSAVLIKLTSSGPVFFRQERYGLRGRKFKLIKFRTMVADAEAQKTELSHLNEMTGPVFKMQNDPRITQVGRFLRKFSLDEFPQFINVLKGDMSIVGPRPPIPNEVDGYEFSQRRRLSVRPGLTCLWQISGRNTVNFEEWVRKDLEYIDKWSLGLDVKIIFKTIPAVLKGSGM